MQRAALALSGSLRTLDGTFRIDKHGVQLGELGPVARLEQTAGGMPAALGSAGTPGPGGAAGHTVAACRGTRRKYGETNAGGAKPAPGTPNGARTAPAGGAGGGGMFRQQALARRSARDTLENLLTITTPRLWLALAACLVAVSAAVIWAVTGSAPTTVSGFGIVLPASGVVNVTALAAGTVTSLPIVTGMQVAQDGGWLS